jgi:CelD/BcsL family acetyltransferase involved in cellulose biosynthesis
MQRQNILDQLANNPDADFKARMEAHHLAGEIAAVVMKLYTQRRHQCLHSDIAFRGPL